MKFHLYKVDILDLRSAVCFSGSMCYEELVNIIFVVTVV
jgi:hypothetical protein